MLEKVQELRYEHQSGNSGFLKTACPYETEIMIGSTFCKQCNFFKSIDKDSRTVLCSFSKEQEK